ncbi:MAG: ion transporter [Leptospiraceae bacterium]|nr:ion transporter [Leptospiraceae bacterium]
MVQISRKVSESSIFQNFITGVILLTAVLVGMETYPSMIKKYGSILHALDKIILGIFVLEIVIKLIARWPKPQMFFSDSWNVFDFAIVAAAFLPIHAEYVTVLRLLRLLRVLRLVRALPQLRILVTALLKSIPSMFYVGIFLFLLFYIYAVAAVFLFSHNDPIHFRDLPQALISLFRAVTLEDWTDLMYIQTYGCEGYGYEGKEHLCTDSTAYPVLSPLFFISFVMMGTMIVLNLFIGVIMNGMDEAKEEMEAESMISDETPSPQDEWKKLEKEMKDLEHRIGSIRKALAIQNARDEEARALGRKT